MRKTISMLLAVVLTLSVAVVPISASGRFTDVPDGQFFSDPVAWAVENEITNGTSGTTFSPEDTCTRGQVVTFLWRANGKPRATAAVSAFTDVEPGSYYADAVQWAVAKGITNGTSATTFSPDAPCTRGQVVTFQWRSAGKPATRNENIFTDVPNEEYYKDAVLWAVDKGITNGTSGTTFSPEDPCTRAHIVTFLFRHLGRKAELTIDQQPKDFFAHVEETGVLNVAVSGGKAPYTYQWQYWDKEWKNVESSAYLTPEGSSLSVYVVNNDGSTHSKYRCIIIDDNGRTVTSQEALGHLCMNKLNPKAFGMFVEDVVSITGQGIVFMGTVRSGKVQLGDWISFTYPGWDGNLVSTEVRAERLVMNGKAVDRAVAGEKVSILIGSPWGDTDSKPYVPETLTRGIFLAGSDQHAEYTGITYYGTFKVDPAYSGSVDKNTTLYFSNNFTNDSGKLTNLKGSLTAGQSAEETVITFSDYRLLFEGDSITAHIDGKTVGTFTVVRVERTRAD